MNPQGAGPRRHRTLLHVGPWTSVRVPGKAPHEDPGDRHALEAADLPRQALREAQLARDGNLPEDRGERTVEADYAWRLNRSSDLPSGLDQPDGGTFATCR